MQLDNYIECNVKPSHRRQRLQCMTVEEWNNDRMEMGVFKCIKSNIYLPIYLLLKDSNLGTLSCCNCGSKI